MSHVVPHRQYFEAHTYALCYEVMIKPLISSSILVLTGSPDRRTVMRDSIHRSTIRTHRRPIHNLRKLAIQTIPFEYRTSTQVCVCVARYNLTSPLVSLEIRKCLWNCGAKQMERVASGVWSVYHKVLEILKYSTSLSSSQFSS